MFKKYFGRFFTSVLAPTLVVLLVLFLLISTGALPATQLSSDTAMEQSNVITYAMSTEPNLDPHWNASATGAMLQSMIREGLYKVTENGIALAGAESVDVNSSATVWTFRLRRDAFWNDGKPVTAGDYVYSMQRLVDPAIATTFMRDYGQFLKNGTEISDGVMEVSHLGVRAIDDYTLEIELANSCTFFDTILTYSAFYPLRADSVSEDGTGEWAWKVENSVTNGAMNMVYCDEAQEIVLEKNMAYWDAANVAADRIVVKLMDDTSAALAMLEAGEIDVIDSFPAEEVERLQAAGLYHSAAKLSTNFLLLNCLDTADNVLTDVQIRKALSLAIDREYLCNVLLRGTKTPAVALVGNGFPGSTFAQDFRTEGGRLIPADIQANVAEAQKLMNEAGYPNGDGFPVITCSFSYANADHAAVFEYLKDAWKEHLGIDVELQPMEPAAMTELRDAGKFEITPQSWGADYMDASNMLSIFVTGNLINGGKYSCAEYDEKYAESLRTVDQAARMALLHRCEELLIVEDCAVIPLYHANAAAIYSEERLENVKIAVNGKIMLTDIVKK